MKFLQSFRVKRAGVEQPNQTQMESDFAQMAFQFVHDRADALTPFGIGFEIVERDDDGSKAIGVFGYKIGNDFYMIPVFFINGQIKGINSLYSKNTNSFMPLTEDSVNKIVGRANVELGSSVDRASVQQNMQMPDLSTFSAFGAKMASPLRSLWQDAVASVKKDMDAPDSPLFKDIAACAVKVAYNGDLETETSASPLLDYLKRSGPRAVDAFLASCTKSAEFANAVFELYGGLEPFKITAFTPDATEFKQKTAEAKKVEIVYAKSTDCATPCCSDQALSDSDRVRMIRDGFRIIDRREKAEKSDLYHVEYLTSYSAPSTPGRYNLLLSSGATTEAWILQPFTIDKRGKSACVETDKHCLVMAELKNVFTQDGQLVQHESAFDRAKPLSAMRIKGRYLIVDGAGSFLGPFTVRATISEPNARDRLLVDWEHVGRADDVGWFEYGLCASQRKQFEIAADQTGAPRLGGDDVVIIPAKGLKALELNSDDGNSYAYREAEKDAFKLGKPADLLSALYKEGCSRIAVNADPALSGTFSLTVDGARSKPMSYKTAFVTLVGRYGYSVDDAEDAITEAGKLGRSQALVKVKLAQDAAAGGVNMPWLQLPEFQGADPYSGMMVQTPQEAALSGYQPQSLPPQQPFAPGMADGTALMPSQQPDPRIMELALAAAQSGQKTIFDHAGIAGLSKLYDVDTVVDSYIPEMTKALDRLGRILFLFQWKNEDFAERFGVDSLPEMEDRLTSVYKSFGDLVLLLKEKSVNPDLSKEITS